MQFEADLRAQFWVYSDDDTAAAAAAAAAVAAAAAAVPANLSQCRFVEPSATSRLTSLWLHRSHFLEEPFRHLKRMRQSSMEKLSTINEDMNERECECTATAQQYG